jgi:hypothetical protein
LRAVAIYGGLLLAAILVLGFGWCIFDQSAKQCVRESVDWLSRTVQMVICLSLATWLGVEADKLWKREWLGWVVGLTVFFGIAMILAYAGR